MSAEPRIAIFLPSLVGGGAQRVAVNLARGFRRAGARVQLVLGSAQGPLLEDVPGGVRVVDLECARVSRAVGPLSKYLRQAQPDVLLSRMYHANVTAVVAHALAGSSARLVLAEDCHISGQLANGGIHRKSILMMRWVYRRAHALIGVSQGVSRDLEKHLRVPSQTVQTIYNPIVDVDHQDKATARPPHPWFHDRDIPVVLAAGRLVHIKDYPTLLRAFALVRRRRPARLVILGDGPERPYLHGLAQQLGIEQDIALPGFVANPLAAMSRASAYVLSSQVESFSNTLVEAMASDCPVISTDCPCGPREILAGGRFGRLVACENPERMAESIEEVLASRPDTTAARQRALEFSFDNIVPHYLQVMDAESAPSRKAA